MLIDLCTGPLAPWLPMVIAKVINIDVIGNFFGYAFYREQTLWYIVVNANCDRVSQVDLAIEFLEDLLGVIQVHTIFRVIQCTEFVSRAYGLLFLLCILRVVRILQELAPQFFI